MNRTTLDKITQAMQALCCEADATPDLMSHAFVHPLLCLQADFHLMNALPTIPSTYLQSLKLKVMSLRTLMQSRLSDYAMHANFAESPLEAWTLKLAQLTTLLSRIKGQTYALKAPGSPAGAQLSRYLHTRLQDLTQAAPRRGSAGLLALLGLVHCMHFDASLKYLCPPLLAFEGAIHAQMNPRPQIRHHTQANSRP